MKDKSLGIWLIIMFGLSGISLIALAWLWPTLEADRILATLVGGVGIAIAVIRALTLKQSTGKKQVTVEVESES
jgi:hypothetical protein